MRGVCILRYLIDLCDLERFPLRFGPKRANHWSAEFQVRRIGFELRVRIPLLPKTKWNEVNHTRVLHARRARRQVVSGDASLDRLDKKRISFAPNAIRLGEIYSRPKLVDLFSLLRFICSPLACLAVKSNSKGGERESINLWA